MIFLVQFGILVSTCKFFKDPQILLVFEKFSHAYLFQIALKIM